MKTIFGVSSATPLSKKLKNGYTLYDWVKKQRCFPEFCMRTLLSEDKVTPKEIEFLRNKNCKIGLVVRDLIERKVSGINGSADAVRAADAANELGVPTNCGIAIFVGIGPEWSINHN